MNLTQMEAVKAVLLCATNQNALSFGRSIEGFNIERGTFLYSSLLSNLLFNVESLKVSLFEHILLFNILTSLCNLLS